MIVNSLADGWEIIYQRSHANLAAMLVAAWREADHTPRWTELVIATAQHDDQEMYWDQAQHLTDIGAPIDFAQTDFDTTQIEARSVIANAYRQGLWIALLISRHNSFLHEPKRGQDANMDAFLDEQRDNQTTWRDELGIDQDVVDRAYSFLRWGDRLSLILCRDRLTFGDRWIDIAPGPDGQMVRASQADDGTVALDPWVLEQDSMDFSVEVRRLRQLKFTDDDDFLDAMGAAKLETRSWRFKRPT
jgi:hypothetical protein